ncbi:hypothetical protein V6S67_10495 [Arthrobacter sp. Soc17.1.1.1]|uniref:DUF6993 domain-containing protein n=1 Tax=Arthrobacter sp. Soc17.1.1.1 TaxID=3121277 RepID=UPI002FE48BA6
MITAVPAQPDRPTTGRRRTAGAAALAAVLLALSSCAASPVMETPAVSAAPADEPGDPATTAPPPEGQDPQAGTAPPEDDLSGVSGAVDSALRALAAGQDAVTSDQVRGAIEQGFAASGAAAETVEVTVDRTPTGLDVDAIQGAGLLEGRCVFGEVREGVVSVVVLPALASGRCFVGDQR